MPSLAHKVVATVTPIPPVAAVDVLLESWPQAHGLEYRQALLRALSISRHERAIEFLKQLAAEGRPQDAADARAALALFPEKHAE